MCGTCGCGDPQVTDPQALRVLELHRSLLSRNDAQAAANRAHFHAHGLLSLNMLSAPGSGKTALLEQLARRWPQRPIAVIVGDQATDNDARRLDSAGGPLDPPVAGRLAGGEPAGDRSGIGCGRSGQPPG